jgi:hypothetical protein
VLTSNLTWALVDAALKARKDLEMARRLCVPSRWMPDNCEDDLMPALLCEYDVLDMFAVMTDSDHERREQTILLDIYRMSQLALFVDSQQQCFEFISHCIIQYNL